MSVSASVQSLTHGVYSKRMESIHRCFILVVSLIMYLLLAKVCLVSLYSQVTQAVSKITEQRNGGHDFMGQEIPIGYVNQSISGLNVKQPSTGIGKNGRETIKLLGDHLTHAQMLGYVQDTLNFTVRLYPSHTWAFLNKNNEWEGMAGQLLSHQIYVAADSAYMLIQRVRKFRFLTVGYRNKLSAYFQIPFKFKNVGIGRLKDDVTFNAIGKLVPYLTGFVIVIIIILVLVYNLDFSSAMLMAVGNSQGATPAKVLGLEKIKDVYMYHIYWMWTSTSLKIACYSLTTCFYIWNSYLAASLISTFSTNDKVINNLQDLIDEGYRFGVLHDSYLIKTNTDENVPKYLPLERIMKNPSLETRISGIQRLLSDPKFALLTEVDDIYETFENVTESKIPFCDVLHEIRLEEEPITAHAFVRQGSNLSDPFNYAMVKMWTSGISQRFWTKYEQQRIDLSPSCPPGPDDGILIVQLQSPLAVITLAFLLCPILFILERYNLTLGNHPPYSIVAKRNVALACCGKAHRKTTTTTTISNLTVTPDQSWFIL